MLSNRSNEVLTYWYSLQKANSAPLRTQLDPTAIRSRLPDLFMLGWRDLDLVFRLAGTRVCELFGEELREQAFHDLWRPRDKDKLIDAALSAMRSELPVACDVSAIQDSSAIPIEILLLPLRAPDGNCDRLLGTLLPGKIINHAHPVERGSLALLNWEPASRPGIAQVSEHSVAKNNKAPSFLQRLLQIY